MSDIDWRARLAAYHAQRAELGLNDHQADELDGGVPFDPGPCPWCGEPAIPGHGRPADAEPGEPGPCDSINGSFSPGDLVRVHYRWAIRKGWRIHSETENPEFVNVEVPR